MQREPFVEVEKYVQGPMHSARTNIRPNYLHDQRGAEGSAGGRISKALLLMNLRTRNMHELEKSLQVPPTARGERTRMELSRALVGTSLRTAKNEILESMTIRVLGGSPSCLVTLMVLL